MTDEMKPYIDHISNENNTDKSLNEDEEGELTEGLLRGLSAMGLINKIRKLGGEIKKAKSVEKQLELVGSQILYLGMLMFVKT
jgi:hypothetical protein